MDKRTKDLAVGGLAVAAVAASLYFGFGGREPKLDLDTYAVLGAVTAEETARLAGDQGRVMVLARDTGAARNPSVEAELAAFQRTLKQHRGLSLVTERIPVTPMQMMATGGGLPAEAFLKALATHARLGAVVLFFGFPQLAEPELETLKKSGVKTVVVSSFRPGYKELLERQAIQLAIVPRASAPAPGAPAARTVRERFDQEYSLVTAVTAQK